MECTVWVVRDNGRRDKGREDRTEVSGGMRESGGEAEGRSGHCWLEWIVLTVRQPLPGRPGASTLSLSLSLSWDQPLTHKWPGCEECKVVWGVLVGCRDITLALTLWDFWRWVFHISLSKYTHPSIVLKQFDIVKITCICFLAVS